MHEATDKAGTPRHSLVSGIFSYTFQEQPSATVRDQGGTFMLLILRPSTQSLPCHRTAEPLAIFHPNTAQIEQHGAGNTQHLPLPMKSSSSFTSLIYSYYKLKESPDLPTHLGACESVLPPPPPPLLLVLQPPGAHPKGSSAGPMPRSVPPAAAHTRCSPLPFLACRFHTHFNIWAAE